jgi:hypothetical protein
MYHYGLAGQIVKKVPAFCGTQRFITMFTRAHHWMEPILSQVHPVHTFPPYFPKIHYTITFPSGFLVKILYVFLIPETLPSV